MEKREKRVRESEREREWEFSEMGIGNERETIRAFQWLVSNLS